MTASQLALDEPEAPKPAGLTTATILEALHRHYRKPGTDRDGEILIPEVQAPGSSRRADLVRVGMWASRGTGIDVHEVKASRADWLRELDDPAKAEAWWPYCNRFWLVTVPGVVQPGELPAGWGLMELPGSGRRFKARVQPEARTDIRLNVPLLVELLRRADNQRLGEMDQLRQRHRHEMYQLSEQWRAKRAEASLPLEVTRRLEALKVVESLLGAPLDQWGGWPKQPVTAITPAELAAFLSDAKAHVTLQRREAGLADRERAARVAARKLIASLEAGDR